MCLPFSREFYIESIWYRAAQVGGSLCKFVYLEVQSSLKVKLNYALRLSVPGWNRLMRLASNRWNRCCARLITDWITLLRHVPLPLRPKKISNINASNYKCWFVILALLWHNNYFRYLYSLKKRRNLRRLVTKSGESNISKGLGNSGVPGTGTFVGMEMEKWIVGLHNYLVYSISTGLFTWLVDAKWRWTGLIFFASFYVTWTIFAVLFWLICYFHGDFEMERGNKSP